MIKHEKANILRAWQAHKEETKYFYCIGGSFQILLARIINWTNPPRDTSILKYQLNEESSEILVVPGGFANGIRSITNNSKLLIFSDKTLEDSKQDDYRFAEDYWKI